jgi:hypothetical protein
MNCQTCRNEIEESATIERLSDEARTHLSACAPCRAFYDERQSLKRLIGGLGKVSAPPDFDFRLRARISAAKAAGNHHSSWRSLLASAPAIGLAASFALLVAAVVFYNQTKSKTPASPGVAVIESPEQTSSQASVNPVQTVSAPAVEPPISDASGEETVAAVAVAAKNTRSRKTVGNRAVARRESAQPSANDSPIISYDTGVRSAEQIVPGGAAPFNAGMNRVVELPVRSASQPVRVFVDDKSGAKRSVTLEPVIFGSQDLMGRNAPRPASSQGIW